MLSSVSLFAINLYQRHLSPRKGYACAYRVEHGDWTGCSGYAKHRIAEVGLWNAVPDIRARLKACREAAEERKERRERRRQNGDNAACGAVEGCDTCSDCATAGGKCGKGCDGPGCDGPDCGSCS
jgi:uncharacterized protein